MLGLPAHVRACLFDLDGVLTRTTKVPAAAWKQMFDGCLREDGVDVVVRDLAEFLEPQ
ncbi:hypothetical protein [Streptomyces sp. NPDC001480]|uniref:hypothetical protein n=1 Tax=Streptomyces sp. NPDC001480 TaxID=3364577 RepID=UPI0036AD8366